MTDHQIHEHADATIVAGGDERVEGREVSEDRIDRQVVGDVLAHVRERRGMDRGQPDRVDAERVGAAPEVIEPGDDAREVADPIAIRVGEGADVDFVEDGRASTSSSSGR